jgi:hypothetical protein
MGQLKLRTSILLRQPFNSSCEILLFASYLALHHRATLDRLVPPWMTAPGASLWLRKVS